MRSVLLASALSLSLPTLISAVSSPPGTYFISAFKDYDLTTMKPSGFVGAKTVSGKDESIMFPYGQDDPPNDNAPCYKFNGAGDKAKMIAHSSGKTPCSFGLQLLFYATSDCSDGIVWASTAQIDMEGEEGKVAVALPAGDGVASYHVVRCPSGHHTRDSRRTRRSRG
ncbi:MAG: hypothetical protein Q9160_001085 [Pyrenula sp. 1 TL-2023]